MEEKKKNVFPTSLYTNLASMIVKLNVLTFNVVFV